MHEDADGDLVMPRRTAPALLPRDHSPLDSALAQLLLLGEGGPSGSTVLELQCGRTAIASLVAAQCGARLAYATDGGGDGGRSLGEVAAGVRKRGVSTVRVRRLDPCELPRLLLAADQPADEEDDAAAEEELDWGTADLRELRRTRLLLGRGGLLGQPPRSAPQSHDAEQAAALLQACRTWVAGGAAAVDAERVARALLSGETQGTTLSSAAGGAAMAAALAEVLQEEAEGGGARTLLLAVDTAEDAAEAGGGEGDAGEGGEGDGEGDDEDGEGGEGEGGGGGGGAPFRWRAEAPPARLAARLRCLTARGLEAQWATAAALHRACRARRRGAAAALEAVAAAALYVVRVRPCEGSATRKRKREEAEGEEGEEDDDDEVPASSPYYGYAVAPGAAPPADPRFFRCVQLPSVFDAAALARLGTPPRRSPPLDMLPSHPSPHDPPPSPSAGTLLAALDAGGSPRDTTPGFKRAATECLHFSPATAWLFAPVVAALRRAAAALGATVGWVTPLQYNRYEEDDHFEQLHLDEIAGPTSYKELSVVIFLSEPASYEGGRFEVGQPPPEPATRTLETAANSAVVFRAQHVAHRVTRVQRGCRRSLVAWATARDVSQQYEQCTAFEEVGKVADGA